MVLIASLLMNPFQAQADEGPCAIPWRVAYYQQGRTAPLRKLVRCAERHWDAPGGARKALSVVACESGFRPDAYNPAGLGYGGLMQHSLRYWPARAENLLPKRWDISRSWRSARANIIVGIKIAHSQGWGPWAGCA